MRYKLIALAAVLLIGTPVSAQETSPIVIKTGQPTPSAVRSGESFKVTYRAEFYDEVLIIEEQMQPENVVAEPFEAIKLEIVSLPDRGDDSTGVIHIKDFVYTFRIIKPEKSEKKIPSFNFIWVIKKAGTTQTDAKEGNELREIPTEEVGVRYVYSPVKPPPMNIRDEMNFPSFGWNGWTFRKYAYGTIAGSVLLSLLAVAVLVYFGKTKAGKVSGNKSGGTAVDATVEIVSSVLPKKARKKFLQELRKLLGAKSDDISLRKLEARIFALLREFILVELSGTPVKASVSDTPSELLNRLKILGAKQKKAMGLRYAVFTCLTGRLRNYYEDIESGQTAHFSEPRSEIQFLIIAIEEMGFWKRFKKALMRASRAG